jgi:hypothetical protein
VYLEQLILCSMHVRTTLEASATHVRKQVRKLSSVYDNFYEYFSEIIIEALAFLGASEACFIKSYPGKKYLPRESPIRIGIGKREHGWREGWKRDWIEGREEEL